MEKIELTFSGNQHLKMLTDSLKTNRKNEKFCDITILCKNKTIHAHRVVLSIFSSFFSKLFEKIPSKTFTVKFSTQVNYEDLNGLIDLMYGEKVYINFERMTPFMTTAKLLGMQGLVKQKLEVQIPEFNLTSLSEYDVPFRFETRDQKPTNKLVNGKSATSATDGNSQCSKNLQSRTACNDFCLNMDPVDLSEDNKSDENGKYIYEAEILSYGKEAITVRYGKAKRLLTKKCPLCPSIFTKGNNRNRHFLTKHPNAPQSALIRQKVNSKK